MALKVELKPGEKIIVGDSVLTNGDQRTRLFVEGQAPILREKDILTPGTANTPAKRIYLAIQMMYLDGDLERHHDDYFTLVNDFIQAAPSAMPYIQKINNTILTGTFYKALKDARELIAYEEDLIQNALSVSSGVSDSK
ncbi:flagellar biosynthesis repressor FlbT [Coralliovum pocilloporae]|uniref:flagellar biosynthesis repressor FlbT n=1 Tax=Coralliovum pocilloporae TaxID=3066369 RepID=UPI003307B1F3